MKLTPEARNWWRLWSNQLALLVAAAGAWAVENQALVLSWIEAVPQPWRSALTFFVLAVIPISLRMLSQPRLSDAPEHDRL